MVAQDGKLRLTDVADVKPTEDEIKAIQSGQKEFKAGEYTDWKDIKAKMSSDV